LSREEGRVAVPCRGRKRGLPKSKRGKRDRHKTVQKRGGKRTRFNKGRPQFQNCTKETEEKVPRRKEKETANAIWEKKEEPSGRKPETKSFEKKSRGKKRSSGQEKRRQKRAAIDKKGRGKRAAAFKGKKKLAAKRRLRIGKGDWPGRMKGGR